MKIKSSYISFPLLLSFCAGTSTPSETRTITQQVDENPALKEIVSNLKLQLESTSEVEILKASEQSLTSFLTGPFVETFAVAESKASIQNKSFMSNITSLSLPIKVYYIRLVATVAAITLVLFCSATYLQYLAKKPEVLEEKALPFSPTASNQEGKSNLPQQDKTSTVAPQLSATTIASPKEEDYSPKPNEGKEDSALLSASTANNEDHSSLEARQKESPISPPIAATTAEDAVVNPDSLSRIETPLTSTAGVKEKNDPIMEEEAIAGNPPISIPTAFTPNGDGNNDYLAIKINHSVQRILKFEVYDRWGQVNFKAINFRPKNTKQKWDGTFRKKPAPAGVYIVMVVIKIKGGETKSYTEEVSLMR